MNGVRSAFTRKGHVLTALAAAVLLVASSGTASAQVTVGFVETSGTVAENASARSDTPPQLKAVVRATGLPAGSERAAALTQIGIIEVRTSDRGAARVASATDDLDTSDIVEVDFTDLDEVTLTILPQADDDFLDESITIKLSSDNNAFAPVPGIFRVTVEDDEVAPSIRFVNSSGTDQSTLRLTELSNTSVLVGIFPGAAGASIPSDAIGDIPDAAKVKLKFSPADAVTVSAEDNGCPTSGADFGKYAIHVKVDDVGMLDKEGVVELGKKLNEYSGRSEETLTISACNDVTHYRDRMVTVEIDPKSLETDQGNLLAGPPLVITAISDDAIPDVSFSTTRLLVGEGRDATVAILAEGSTAGSVDMVSLRVSGDAKLTLKQGKEDIAANDDGTYTVDLAGSVNALLTISADEDSSLTDGGTKTATITFADANGANVGDRSEIMVTVEGVTAVPALPLVGQLLLGLLLLAGGARLHRRRLG